MVAENQLARVVKLLDAALKNPAWGEQNALRGKPH
jgi:hypothetical protein